MMCFIPVPRDSLCIPVVFISTSYCSRSLVLLLVHAVPSRGIYYLRLGSSGSKAVLYIHARPMAGDHPCLSHFFQC